MKTMRYWPLVLLQLRTLYRSAVPSRPIRLALAAFAIAATLLLAAAFVYVARVEQRVPTSDRTAFPVFIVMLITGMVAGVAGLGRPDHHGASPVYRLAPITNAAAVFIPLAAVLLLCALSVGVTAVPIAASAFAAGLPDVIRSVIMAGLAAAWSCCLAILLVAAIRKSAEANRAQRIVRALPGSIGSLTLVVPSMVASLKLDRWTPMILLALTAATPWLAVAAARAWTLTISASPSRASAPEPVWGSPGWLRLLCNRTPFLWALAGLVPGLLVVANRMPALVSALLAMLPLLAASHLMEWEHSRPERLALAPDSRRFRLRLIATVSIPLTALALPLLMLAVREPRTIAALTMVAAAAPLTTLVRGRMIRVPLQAAIFITALAIANRAA